MKKLVSLLLVLAIAVTLVACGGSKPAETQAPAAATEAAAPAATEAAAAPAKKWIIASDTVFKPFEYTDASGNFVGIDVDILAAVAADQGFDYELKSLGWDAAIAACQAGQADGMIAGASITEERKASGWIFSDGYYNATQSMTV